MSLWLTENKVPIVDPAAATAFGGSIRRADESIPPSTRTPAGEARPGLEPPSPEPLLTRLRTAQAEHGFWNNRLFRAAAAGSLDRDDFALVFSQYYLYSQCFTRYLAALMANCENDLHRAMLAQNIWEEGGGAAHSQRHAEIFRRFLVDGLGVDLGAVDFLDATRFFVREYLDFCMRSHPAAGAAFLSLGTEGIVPRMYGIFLDGLSKAGIGDEHLGFFHLHVECDDAHAETLERILASYAGRPDWFSTCQRAMDYALGLRARFFEQLFDAVQLRRVQRVLGHIQAGASLAPEEPGAADLRHRPGAAGRPLYENRDERLGIDFTVERLPFATDVFDARLLKVAAGKRNERHKHPHESLFYVIRGRGKVRVNRAEVEIGPGDVVFVPRWALHQSESVGEEDLEILAVTDFGLTERAYIGDQLKTTRLKGKQASR